MKNERKKQEAIARQEAYDKLTTKEKYDRLADRPGECAKERKKLLQQMRKEHVCGDDCKCGQKGGCCGQN